MEPVDLRVRVLQQGAITKLTAVMITPFIITPCLLLLVCVVVITAPCLQRVAVEARDELAVRRLGEALLPEELLKMRGRLIN